MWICVGYMMYYNIAYDICRGCGSDILLITLFIACGQIAYGRRLYNGYITVNSFSDSVKSSKSFEVTQPKSSILTPNLPGI